MSDVLQAVGGVVFQELVAVHAQHPGSHHVIGHGDRATASQPHDFRIVDPAGRRVGPQQARIMENGECPRAITRRVTDDRTDAEACKSRSLAVQTNIGTARDGQIPDDLQVCGAGVVIARATDLQESGIQNKSRLIIKSPLPRRVDKGGAVVKSDAAAGMRHQGGVVVPGSIDETSICPLQTKMAPDVHLAGAQRCAVYRRRAAMVAAIHPDCGLIPACSNITSARDCCSA